VIVCVLLTGIVRSASADVSLLSAPIDMVNVGNGAKRTINVPSGLQDLSGYHGARITLVNTGNSYCRVEGWFGKDWMRIDGSVHLEPGETRVMTVYFKRHEKYHGNVATLFPGMRALPGGTILHWADINYVTDPKSFIIRVYTDETASVQISDIVAYGDYETPQELAARANFFPFIDVYGQYKHDDWPGKIHSDADLQQAILDEQADLAAHPAPPIRNEYGGWASGPRLEATGHFRVEKYEGKWWFVDPAGALFWSFGVTGVGDGAAETLTQGRESFYTDLPQQSDPTYGQFVIPYRNNFGGRTYIFGDSNLRRKYGSDWFDLNRTNIMDRLKSWGLNTMANWSQREFFMHAENRTPYTVAVHFSTDRIHSSVDVPDPFSSTFRTKVNNGVRNAMGTSLSDSYCIGFFVDNEIRFKQNGVKHYVANGYMKQAGGAPGKTALIQFLQGKYGSIAALNSAWGESYADWDAVAALTAFPGSADEDAIEWEGVFAGTLYRIYNEEAKKVAPHKLYMGSRFLHDTPMHIVNAAAPHLDVVSLNWYRASPKDIWIPSIDKPMVIGEFHFGAVERGYFHTGLRGVGTQVDRAEAYTYYYRDALNHPNLVGTHWFQYLAQSPTGRKDGENYQIGMVDVCDNPYPELRAAARDMGASLYLVRSGLIKPADSDRDGIPDTIEDSHGLNRLDDTDAAADKDRDGKSNLSEFVLGTDISIPDSPFLLDFSMVDSQARLIIPSAFIQEGRAYDVEYCTELLPEGNWDVIDSFIVPSDWEGDYAFDYPLEAPVSFFRARVRAVQ
jgi:hypothetical protein